MSACKLSATWDQLVQRKKTGSGVAFKIAGLGRLEDMPRFKVHLALGSVAFYWVEADLCLEGNRDVYRLTTKLGPGVGVRGRARVRQRRLLLLRL